VKVEEPQPPIGERLTDFVKQVTAKQVTAEMHRNLFNRIMTDGIMTNICAESLKSLEVKFESHLQSIGGLRANKDLVKDMGYGHVLFSLNFYLDVW
jgi:hypothetical protein